MRKRTLTISLAVLSVLSMATAASADSGGIGTTKLALDPDTAEALADMGIGIEPTGNARFAQGFLKFEVKNGQIVDGKGQLAHTGGIAMSMEGGSSVKFTQFILKVGNSKGKVFAKSDHAAVRLFDVDLTGQAAGRSEFNFRVKEAPTTLAKPGAEVLSDTFDFPFRKGTDIGLLTAKADVPPPSTQD
jgi:hypothetical protein